MSNARFRAPVALFIVSFLLSGCGGGGNGASGGSGTATSPSPTSSSAEVGNPPPAWPDSVATPLPTGPAYYFSDCESGAQSGCLPGDNANAGTNPAAPKRTLTGFNVNSLPAGSQVLFARGGAWSNFKVVVQNLNATPAAPLFFDSYSPGWGGTAAPLLKTTTTVPAVAFEFGTWQDLNSDGGYVVRNLKLDGQGVSEWGLWLRDNLRNVIVENIEITGFKIGVHSQSGAPHGITSFTLRNSNIHHNSGMGMLGDGLEMVIENNTFASNNFSGSGFDHGLYLGGHGRNGVVRGNTFLNNSVVGGRCTGGNLTVHGQWNGLLIERNTITQVASDGGCYGISINSAYNTAEWFRNLIVRSNIISNVGNCSICLTSAPGAIVENNLIVNSQARYHAAILIPDRTPDVGDDVDSGAIIRNNTIYLSQPTAWSQGIALRPGSGGNLQVVSNLIYFGAAADATHACFADSPLSSFLTFANNLCHHAGSGTWSATYRTLANAQAAGFDTGGLSSDPQLAMVPSSASNWNDTVNPTSPVINAGHPLRSSAQDRLSIPRVVPDIGSRER